MIRSLREEVRHSLRSGVSITSVGQCVEELVLNSTDAQATCIAARVDLETFRIQVVDNGHGLCQEDMEKVGMRYFTSKCHSLKDLENLKFNGFRGEAISSMADVSSIVDISSKFKNTARTFSKLFQNGKPLQVKETEENRPSAGTTVTVYNLFYNLPVRRKHMDHVLEFEKIRQRLESVSLLNPSISFSLKNDAGQSVVLQLPKTKDTRSRFCQIYGLDRSQKLREIQHSLKGFSMSGFISIEGHYNKSMQYLYVNNRLVLKTKLHKFIDFILRKESVVCRPKNMQKVHSSPGRHRSCSELHGIFIINIHCHYSEYDVCLEPAKTLIEFQDWDSVLQCIEDGVKTFLKRENLFLEQPAEGVDELRDMNYCGPSTKSNLHHVEKQDSAGITSACDSVMESYDMSNLKSKTVCRSKILNGNMSQVCEIHGNDRNKIQEPLGTQNTLNDEPGEFSVRDMTERADPRMFSDKLHPTTSICFDKGSSYTFDNTENKSNSNVCSESSQCPPKSVMQKEVVCERLERENGVQNKQVAECSVIEPLIQCEHSLISDNFNKDEKDGGALYYSLGREDSYKPPIPTPSINQDSLAVAQSDNKGLSVSGTNSSIETAALSMICPKLLPPAMPINTTNTSNGRQICQLFSRPGPVSAMEILQNKINDVNSNIRQSDKMQTSPYSLETVGMNNPWTACLTSRKNKEYITQAQHKSCSSVPHHDSTWTTNISKRTVSRTLSLMPQMGSLEKFRRRYGKLQLPGSYQANLASASSGKISFQDNPESEMQLNNNNAEHIPSNEVGEKLTNSTVHVQSCSLERLPQNPSQKTVILEGEKALKCNPPQMMEIPLNCNKPQMMESPLTLSEYTSLKLNSSSDPRMSTSLTSKISKLKQNMKKSKCLGETRPINPLSKSTSSHELSVVETVNQNVATRSEINKNDFHTTNKCKQPGNASLNSEEQTHCNQQTDNNENNIIALNPHCEETKGSVEPPATVSVKCSEEDLGGYFSADWLQCYEESLGRNVFINKTTGLSSYSAPVEEMKTVCTTDLTTTAINFVCSNGFQYRCHPFRSELLLPFLPRPREERDPTRQHKRGDGDDDDDCGSSDLQSLFSQWENPVFARHPAVAVDVSSEQSDTVAVKIHNILYPYRFTKEMIHSMKVLQQVDNKFIACLMNTKMDESGDQDGNLLVLVDQHAAHERVRLEQLIADSYEPVPGDSGKRKLKVSLVSPPLELDVTEENYRLLRVLAGSLENVGLSLSFLDSRVPRVLVAKVPLCFVEKEANETQRGRSTVAKILVEEFLQEQVELLQMARGARGTVPLTVLKVLASQACHGAVKFNDPLSLEECRHLVQALSHCHLPFQCAHGRPSLLPLADLRHLEPEEQVSMKPNLRLLKRRHRAWELYGKQSELHSTSDVHEINKALYT